MIRERRLNIVSVAPGSTSTIEIAKDAVFHQFQLEIDGAVKVVYPSGTGTTVVNTQFAEGFPANLISRVRLIRNGSDVVWQGSGKQLAKESLFLNCRFPFARIWNDSSSGTGTAGNILQATVLGVSIPANSEGVGCNNAVFHDTATAAATSITDFRCVLELWLQLGVDDYFTTLIDARPLASYVLEITWDTLSNYVVTGAGAGGTGTATLTGFGGSGSASCSVMSYDQDNLPLGIPFGTFKRASYQPPGVAFGSTNIQALLPRGNMYYGVQFETLGLKAAGLVTIPQPGNDIVTELQNRINSNYALRDVFFRDLQAKNRNDGLVPSSPYDVWGGGPLGHAVMYYPCTGDSVKELVASYTMDQFDFLLSTSSGSSTSDGNTYNGNPVINLLTQEVIPGKSVAQSAARGAQAGSISATSAKPGA